MLQPSQDKSKILYDAVSKDYNIGTYDEFKSKLNNPEKRKAFYNGVGKEYALGTYDEFEKKITTIQTPKPQPINKMFTDNLKLPKPVYGDILNAPKAKKQSIKIEPVEYELLDQYSKITVPDEVKQSNKQQVEDEVAQKGIINNALLYGKKAINKIGEGLDVVNDIITLGDKTDIPKIATDPLSEEKKQAKKILLEQKVPLKNINARTVLDLAKNIKTKKLNDAYEESAKSDFLSEMQSLSSGDGKTKKDVLVSAQNKELLKAQNAERLFVTQRQKLADEYAMSIKEMQELKSEIEISRKNGNPLSQDFIDKANFIQQKNKAIVDSYEKTTDEYIKYSGKVKTAKDNLDLMKRDYNEVKNFLGNLGLAFGEAYAGIEGAKGYIENIANIVVDGKSGITPSGLRAMSIKSDIEEERKSLAKQTNIDNIKDLGDFGKFLFNNVITNQAPNLAMASTGIGGIGLIGMSATGSEYNDMLSQSLQGEKFSNSEMIFRPLAVGASESVSSLTELALMKNASRVVKSASEAERNLIASGMAKQALELGKTTVKGGIGEITEESLTSGFQNVLRGDDFFKDFKDTAGASGAIGMLIPFAGGVVAKSVKRFSLDNSIQKSFGKTLKLERELLNENLSNEEISFIEESIKNSKAESQSLLKKQVKKIGEMSNENFVEINNIEEKQAKLKEKALDIRTSENISNDVKKELLKDLENKFKKTEENRIDILEGRKDMPKKIEETPITTTETVSQPIEEAPPVVEQTTTDTKEQPDEVAPSVYPDENIDSEQPKAEVVQLTVEQPTIAETPKTETKQSKQPQQGDKIDLPPRIKNGIPRVMQFDNGTWKEVVGENLVEVGKAQIEEAQNVFDSNNVVEAKNEQPTKPAETTIDEEQDAKIHEANVSNFKDGLSLDLLSDDDLLSIPDKIEAPKEARKVFNSHNRISKKLKTLNELINCK